MDERLREHSHRVLTERVAALESRIALSEEETHALRLIVADVKKQLKGE